MFNMLRRWRTWIFNIAAALLVLAPDILQGLAGFDWGTIIPPQYMPWFTVGVIVVNVVMRPRAAVLPHERQE